METELLNLYRSLESERQKRIQAEEWRKRKEWNLIRSLAKENPPSSIPSVTSALARSKAESEFKKRKESRQSTQLKHSERLQRLWDQWERFADEPLPVEPTLPSSSPPLPSFSPSRSNPSFSSSPSPKNSSKNVNEAVPPVSKTTSPTVSNGSVKGSSSPSGKEKGLIPKNWKKGTEVSAAELMQVLHRPSQPKPSPAPRSSETSTVSDRGEGETVGLPPPVWESTVPNATGAVIVVGDRGEGTERWAERLRVLQASTPFLNFYACAAPLVPGSPPHRQWTSHSESSEELENGMNRVVTEMHGMDITRSERDIPMNKMNEMDVAALPVLLLVHRLLMGGLLPERIVLLARGEGAWMAFRVACVLLEQPLCALLLLHSSLGPLLSQEHLPPAKHRVTVVEVVAQEEKEQREVIEAEVATLQGAHWSVEVRHVPTSASSPHLLGTAWEWIASHLPQTFQPRSSTTKWL